MIIKKKGLNLSILFTTFVLGVVLSGCNPDSLSPNTPLKTGEMTATITGTGTFFASDAVAQSGSTYDIRASVKNNANADSLIIQLKIPKQTLAPYTVNLAIDDNSKITYCIFQSTSCDTYTSDKSTSGSSGQIKITSTSPNLEGTFSGTLVQVGGSKSVTITNGAFNAGF